MTLSILGVRRIALAVGLALVTVAFVACSAVVPGDPDTGLPPPRDAATDAPMSGA